MVHIGGYGNEIQTDDFYCFLFFMFPFLRLWNYSLFLKLLMVEQFNAEFTDFLAGELFSLTADSIIFLAHALRTN